jgi:hypothetical protein
MLATVEAEARKDFFSEEKKQKTFIRWSGPLSGESRDSGMKVFWFFFSKKNFFLPSIIGQPQWR